MSIALTKVLVPRRRRGFVSRRRLLDFLHRHLERRLSLVIAPAGYGKTALLVDFAHEVRAQGVPVCWLTLDRDDADVRTFLEHLILALQQRFPHVGHQTAQLLRNVDDAAKEYRALATALCNEMVSLADDFFLLVLDDYHAVHNAPAVNGVVDVLLERMPEGFRLLIGGRMIPTRLDLVRLAARLEVAGLGAIDLRFDARETAELIRAQQGVDIHPREAERAVRHAEGWVTAILLSLHSQESVRFASLAAAKSRPEPLFDYLARKVFDHLDPTLKQFLLESAVLPAISPTWCDVVLGRTDSADRIAEAIESGLFVEPLESGGDGPSPDPAAPRAATAGAAGTENGAASWLRYHQLWRAFLLEQLRERDPARLEALRRAAARYALEQGDTGQAVEQLLALDARDEAADLIERVAEDDLAGGHAERLLQWIEYLPEPVLATRPLLLLHAAQALRRLDRLRDSLEFAQRAETIAVMLRQRDAALLARSWRAQVLAFLGQSDAAVTMVSNLFDQLGRQRVRSELKARFEQQACVTLAVSGRFRDAVGHGSEALRLARYVRDRTRRRHIGAIVHHTIGLCLSFLGQMDEAAAHFERAAQLWQQLGNAVQQARVLNGIALMHQRAGRLDEAVAHFERALEVATGAGHGATEADTLVNLACALRELGRLDEASEAIERALPLARDAEEARILGEAQQEAGLLALLRGEPLEAVQLLEAAMEIAQEQWAPGLALSSALLALAHARAGQRSEAKRRLSEARTSTSPAMPAYERVRVGVALAAAQAALRQHDDALAELRALRTQARRSQVLHAFFTECAQYAETARLLLGERRLDPQVAGRLQATLERVPQGGPAKSRAAARLRALPASAPDTFDVRLFGTPSVHRNGELVQTWRTTLVRELFFYLMLHAGEPVRTEALIEALLPEEDFDRSLTAIRHAMHHVRRFFAPHNPIRTLAGAYCLTLEPELHCDVVEFRQLLARAAPVRGQAALDLLEAAVRRYRGPLLDGIDSTWVLAPRADLERRFLTAAHTLLDAYTAGARHEEAIAIAQHVLAIDPFQEDFHLALMRHQIALGHLAAARQHYRRYSRLMREELGQEPAAEAAALVHASRH